MRAPLHTACKFYTGGVVLYPEGEIFREISFISYYYHWDLDRIMTLDHKTRRRFCAEISAIHKEVMNAPKNIFEV